MGGRLFQKRKRSSMCGTARGDQRRPLSSVCRKEEEHSIYGQTGEDRSYACVKRPAACGGKDRDDM
jgi:hypothetical protein